jgi:glycosyltransferase involved in cell wall biosynthesis
MQLIFILININASIHICQFAGYHSFLPALFSRILKKKSVIVAGGTDCVSFPEIGYGNFHKKILGRFTCLSYRLSDAILPVDESLIESENVYSENHSKKQGIKNHCKNLKTNFSVIYNGYSGDFWKNSGKSEFIGDIISVSAGMNEKRRYILKGIDLLVELAKNNGHLTITLVGGLNLPEGVFLPENVKLIGACNAEQLKELYSSHKYYAQLSISEGFPNAICEAMLCGCIPIGSNVAASPKIIGKEGFILNQRSAEELEKLLSHISSSDCSGLKPRERIINHFSFEKRKQEFLSFLKSLEFEKAS